MDFAPPVAARRCTGGPTPGAVALARRFLERFSSRGLALAGIYNCRTVAGTETLSVHAEGRAIDLGVSRADPAVPGEVLDALLGMGRFTLQRIIWNHRIWDAAAPAGRAYSGVNPHTDHLHVELSWPAANGDLPLEIDVDDLEIDEMTPTLICGWRGAQWAVAADLSSKTGIPTGADLQALLDVAEGRAYVATTLSDSLMSRIPDSGAA